MNIKTLLFLTVASGAGAEKTDACLGVWDEDMPCLNVFDLCYRRLSSRVPWLLRIGSSCWQEWIPLLPRQCQGRQFLLQHCKTLLQMSTRSHSQFIIMIYLIVWLIFNLQDPLLAEGTTWQCGTCAAAGFDSYLMYVTSLNAYPIVLCTLDPLMPLSIV